MGIEAVAVYSQGDADARHVRLADQSVGLDGVTAGQTYLDIPAIIAAAHTSEADAIHPGYGFLSERADAATAFADAGLTWVGPPAQAIAAMGDKISAKQLMAEAGVPVLPSVTDPDTAAEVGYPLIVKAAAGGGGKGMRIVTSPEALADAVEAARREAASAFGDDRVFLERFIERPRHIEVQVFADGRGATVHLGERECSIQRRHQKVIEEAPSPAVDPETRERLGHAAVAAARAVDYVGAGTVEFVASQPTAEGGPEFFFLEMNTRLQVEHPVTELAWARSDGVPLDLVRLQLEVAEGRPLPFGQDDLRLAGHAVEARLYAEDPATGFLPVTGPVELLEPANGPGTRWDTGVETGDEIGPHFDPMIAKVIAHGSSRADALRLLGRELSQTRLHGLRTNRDALIWMLAHEEMVAGTLDTGFIDRLDPAVLDPEPSADAQRLHLIGATLAGRARRSAQRRVQESIPTGWRNNPTAGTAVAFEGSAGSTVTVSYRPEGDELIVDVSRTAAGADEPGHGPRVRVSDVRVDGDAVSLTLDGRQWTLRVSELPDGHDVSYGDESRRWAVDSPLGSATLMQLPRFPSAAAEVAPGDLDAPMPGTVLRVAVAEGHEVEEGDLVMVLEAMKMEHRVTAPHAGTVESLLVSEGAQVAGGDTLARIL